MCLPSVDHAGVTPNPATTCSLPERISIVRTDQSELSRKTRCRPSGPHCGSIAIDRTKRRVPPEAGTTYRVGSPQSPSKAMSWPVGDQSASFPPLPPARGALTPVAICVTAGEEHQR